MTSKVYKFKFLQLKTPLIIFCNWRSEKHSLECVHEMHDSKAWNKLCDSNYYSSKQSMEQTAVEKKR